MGAGWPPDGFRWFWVAPGSWPPDISGHFSNFLGGVGWPPCVFRQLWVAPYALEWLQMPFKRPADGSGCLSVGLPDLYIYNMQDRLDYSEDLDLDCYQLSLQLSIMELHQLLC